MCCLLLSKNSMVFVSVKMLETKMFPFLKNPIFFLLSYPNGKNVPHNGKASSPQRKKNEKALKRTSFALIFVGIRLAFECLCSVDVRLKVGELSKLVCHSMCVCVSVFVLLCQCIGVELGICFQFGDMSKHTDFSFTLCKILIRCEKLNKIFGSN